MKFLVGPPCKTKYNAQSFFFYKDFWLGPLLNDHHLMRYYHQYIFEDDGGLFFTLSYFTGDE